MSAVAFVALILLSASGIVFSLAIFSETKHWLFKVTGYLSVLALISSIAWAIVYANTDWKLQQYTWTEVQNVNGLQVITYSVPNSKEKRIVNVNKELGRSFAPGQKVVVEIYSQGPYYGVYSEHEHIKFYAASDYDKTYPPVPLEDDADTSKDFTCVEAP